MWAFLDDFDAESVIKARLECGYCYIILVDKRKG